MEWKGEGGGGGITIQWENLTRNNCSLLGNRCCHDRMHVNSLLTYSFSTHTHTHTLTHIPHTHTLSLWLSLSCTTRSVCIMIVLCLSPACRFKHSVLGRMQCFGLKSLWSKTLCSNLAIFPIFSSCDRHSQVPNRRWVTKRDSCSKAESAREPQCI